MTFTSGIYADAQTHAADSVMNHAGGKRLSIGGYGEAAYSRNFYSDNGNRYTVPQKYKNDPSHGRFDIPHAVIYLGYDFGKGWTLGSEIEFEHGGSGSSIEYEADEAIEFEQENERGGEVELEQFWLQKSFSRALNLKMGHIVVPIGLTNANHEPLTSLPYIARKEKTQFFLVHGIRLVFLFGDAWANSAMRLNYLQV
jgi:hypothetical protein